MPVRGSGYAAQRWCCVPTRCSHGMGRAESIGHEAGVCAQTEASARERCIWGAHVHEAAERRVCACGGGGVTTAGPWSHSFTLRRHSRTFGSSQFRFCSRVPLSYDGFGDSTARGFTASTLSSSSASSSSSPSPKSKSSVAAADAGCQLSKG